MSAILRFWAVFVVTTKRLITQRGLALATSLGLVVAIALTMSIPIYADAVYQKILKEEFSPTNPNVTYTSIRPPYAFMFRYVGAWNGPAQWDKLKPIDDYLSGPVAGNIGLPSQLIVRYFKSDNFKLFPSTDIVYSDIQEPLSWVNFASASDLEKHITLLEGQFPAVASTSPDEPVEILVHEALATKLGLQVGEIYNTFRQDKADQGGKRTILFPVKISGIWKPTDTSEDYWFYTPGEFETVFFVPEQTLSLRIVPQMNGEIYLALWYLILDGSKVHSSDVPSLVGRIAWVRQRADQIFPKTRLDISPMEKLLRYQSSANSLTFFLYAFSIPLMFMILTFIGLVVDMAVAQRRNEIAVLRSRGATAVQILGMAGLESILLGIVSLAVGTPAAQVVAQFFSKTRSFLDFSVSSTIRPDVTETAIRFGLIAVGVGLIAQILPTLSASQHTVVTYKQERARQLRAPWWQRSFMDILLLIPAGYGIYLLRRQGGLTVPGMNQTVANDPFQNPLLLLVPALGIFALTLFFLRILPLIMGALSWILSKTKNVGILLASRYLSRSSGNYNAPLILLILTLSLSTFTATMAQTLDRHLHDHTFYQIGADMNITELGENASPSLAMGFGGGSSTNTNQSTSTSQEDTGPEWYFLPVEEHLKVPGVKAAARVARTPIRILLSSGEVSGEYIGVDRTDFTKVAFWRSDFSPLSLGGLMNNLALTTEGVLVTRDFIFSHSLKPGDTLRIVTFPLGETVTLDMKIVGYFDWFPTWYPEDGPLVVGNLDYLFEMVGGQFPYDVWLKLDPNVPSDDIIKGIEAIYYRLLDWKISTSQVSDEQRRPERQGFFGLLSVGFAALALLTVIGFLLYALFSFRRRFIELGMLRAVGLSAGQMLVFLASELAFLLLVGLGAGTGLGIWISKMFIPYLQVGSDPTARIPPFLVQIDWGSVFQIYILFGLLFLIALIALGALLLRMKIFQAIKLGEAV